jgi:hypothetical protein
MYTSAHHEGRINSCHVVGMEACVNAHGAAGADARVMVAMRVI